MPNLLSAYEMAKRCRWTTKGSRSRVGTKDLPAKRRKTYKEDTRSVDSPAATSESPNEKTDGENSPPVCKGCGRSHLGRCQYTSHPDFNKSDKSWAESENGKKYAKMGICIVKCPCNSNSAASEAFQVLDGLMKPC